MRGRAALRSRLTVATRNQPIPKVPKAERRRAAARIAARVPSRGALVRRGILLGIAGLIIYLLAPRIGEVLGSWPRLVTLEPWWVAAMIGLQVLSLASMWVLQRLAIRTQRWGPIVTSQLAGNAFSRIVPGGAAAGAALQFRMLVRAGFPGGATASGLTTSSLANVAMLLALPVLAVPAILTGTPASEDLTRAALIGAGALVLMFAIGSLFLFTNRPLWVTAIGIEQTYNRVRPRRLSPVRYLPQKLLRERNMIRKTFGERWWLALLATGGRWGFDYLSLLAAIEAAGVAPDPSLVLLAFCVAQLLGMVPFTPGGLGLVEAGLATTLVLAGVPAGEAFLATLAYRLASFWLPLPAGLLAAILHHQLFERGRQEAASSA